MWPLQTSVPLSIGEGSGLLVETLSLHSNNLAQGRSKCLINMSHCLFPFFLSFLPFFLFFHLFFLDRVP